MFRKDKATIKLNYVKYIMSNSNSTDQVMLN